MTRNKVWLLALLLTAAFNILAWSMEFVDDETPVPAVGTLGGPSRPLGAIEMDMFVHGRRVFDRDFHSANGLGAPDFNGDSCRSCHHDPVIGGAGGLDLNVSRFASDNGGAGPFLNLPGGQIVSRLRRPDTPGREEYPAGADLFEQRQTPSVLGLGLVGGIPAATITANEDPLDANGDGIYGVARWIDVNGTQELGRFGWKAQVPTLADFMKDACLNEVGLTVTNTDRGFGSTTDGDPVADPELTALDEDDCVFFMKTLAPPPRGGSTNPAVALGEAVFQQIGCSTCHIPSLMGSTGPVEAYSNFLLHDLHSPGFRGMAEPGAPAGFYRTPPLWGISATAPYMHDGSAETLEMAILAHEGEAISVTLAWLALSAAQRDALTLFLQDL